MTDAPAEHSLDALVDAVRAALAASYEHPVVVPRPATGSVAVLGGKPLALVREALDPQLAARVEQLELDDLDRHAVPVTGLRLWRQHGRSGAAGELVTELAAGDPPLQLVVEDDAWRLVRTRDGAMGWLAPDAPALGGPLAAHEQPDTTDPTIADPERFLASALAHEGAPYVWGGTTAAGVDCSGLVQRAAWDGCGAWLPRHSRALLTVGDRVAPTKLDRGDLLVLQRDPRTYEAEQRARLEAQAAAERATGVPAHGPAIHPMHVAIALSPTEVLHASRDAMVVTREPLASLRERYRILGVRRLGAGRVTAAEARG